MENDQSDEPEWIVRCLSLFHENHPWHCAIYQDLSYLWHQQGGALVVQQASCLTFTLCLVEDLCPEQSLRREYEGSFLGRIIT